MNHTDEERRDDAQDSLNALDDARDFGALGVQFGTLCGVCALCVFVALAVMCAEIVLTAFPDGTRKVLSVSGWFELYERNPLMGMRNMGLINIIASTAMLPVFCGLFAIHRKAFPAGALVALVAAIAGYAVFMADNCALPMLELSRQYGTADQAGRTSLEAAARALLSKGASHTPGTFPGFFLSELAGILWCVLMIRGRVFGRRIGVVGIVSFTNLLVFEVLSSFVASTFMVSMIPALAGGVLALAWYGMTGVRFVALSRVSTE